MTGTRTMNAVRPAATLALAALLASAPPAARAAGDDDVAKLLAAAVDQPTAAARREAAERLAAREDITLDAWHAAMKAFGPKERPQRGSHTERTTLFVGDVEEETAIAVFVPKSYEPGKPA